MRIVSHVIACCVTWNFIIRSGHVSLVFIHTHQQNREQVRVSKCSQSMVQWQVKHPKFSEYTQHIGLHACVQMHKKPFFRSCHVRSVSAYLAQARNTVHQYAGCHPTKSG